MFGMEMEAERRREVLAGATGDRGRHAMPVRSDESRWRGSTEVAVASTRPRPCDEPRVTAQVVRG